MNLKEISTEWIFAELHSNNYSSNPEHELKQLSLEGSNLEQQLQ
jgi:hypothetical protein